MPHHLIYLMYVPNRDFNLDSGTTPWPIFTQLHLPVRKIFLNIHGWNNEVINVLPVQNTQLSKTGGRWSHCTGAQTDDTPYSNLKTKEEKSHQQLNHIIVPICCHLFYPTSMKWSNFDTLPVNSRGSSSLSGYYDDGCVSYDHRTWEILHNIHKEHIVKHI